MIPLPFRAAGAGGIDQLNRQEHQYQSRQQAEEGESIQTSVSILFNRSWSRGEEDIGDFPYGTGSAPHSIVGGGASNGGMRVYNNGSNSSGQNSGVGADRREEGESRGEPASFEDLSPSRMELYTQQQGNRAPPPIPNFDREVKEEASSRPPRLTARRSKKNKLSAIKKKILMVSRPAYVQYRTRRFFTLYLLPLFLCAALHQPSFSCLLFDETRLMCRQTPNICSHHYHTGAVEKSHQNRGPEGANQWGIFSY
jgi:hypothetical protein